MSPLLQFALFTAAMATPIPKSFAPIAQVEEVTLKNGLRVRLAPFASVPTVSYFTVFRVGSRNERPGITGISHLFEHMMFNGAKKYGPGMFDKALEEAGGSSNAYTSNDLTVYYDDVPSESLETVIDLESDRMRSLNISERMLSSERRVVMEERRLRVDNDLAGMLDEELGALIWKAHPYRWPVVGWMKDLERISRDDCMAYFRTYYAPNNATLYVVGDFEPRKVLASIRKHYGDIPKGPVPPVVLDPEPEQKGERRAAVHYPAQAPSVLIGYRGPHAQSDDTLALDVLQYALGVGQSSRLVRQLVYQKQLAVAVSVDWGWRLDPGVFLISLMLKPDSKPAEVEQAVYAELAQVAKDGLSEEELQKARNNLAAHTLRELATNNARGNLFGTYEVMLGSWKAGLTLGDRYQAITADQVQAAARRYFDERHRSVVTLVPEAASP